MLLSFRPGLFFPGWSRTRRRTRKRPRKAQMIVSASDRALSVSDDENPFSKIRTRPGKALMCVNHGPSGPENEGCGFPTLGNAGRVTVNLPPKKRKSESGFSTNAERPDSARSLPNMPLIIRGGVFSPWKKIDMTSNPGPKKDLVVDDNIASGSPVGARKNHVCDICDRAFTSYQALGGHKSHHNNKVTIVGPVPAYDERPEGRFGGFMHKCPFCDRMFSKGQALGGHKRHCRRTMYCGGGQETSNGPTTGFSFDLNELPSEWAPDEMGSGLAC